MEICKLEACFGCALCSDSCPVNAILIEDSYGFYRPIINDKKCLECNMCKKVCPANNISELRKLDLAVPCYAAYSKKESIHYECASGGLCTELSQEFMLNGGIVVGSWYNSKKQQVEHRICDKFDDLTLIAKSKYVQSNLEGIYKEIEKQIKNKKCLFIGVPCQVNAVKRYFEKNNNQDMLYYIDLLCHGGASPLCLKEHMKNVSNGKEIDNISFRGGEYDCNFIIYDKNTKLIYYGPQFVDPYFHAFMTRVIYQEKCYECPFAGRERIGDLTIGDFWGLDESLIPSNGGHGINMVLVNNSKGKMLLNSVQNNVKMIERTAMEAVNGNDTLKKPTEKPADYKELWSRIRKFGFVIALDYYEKNDYSKRCKKAKLQWKNYQIKKVIKKILPDNLIMFLKRH